MADTFVSVGRVGFHLSSLQVDAEALKGPSQKTQTIIICRNPLGNHWCHHHRCQTPFPPLPPPVITPKSMPTHLLPHHTSPLTSQFLKSFMNPKHYVWMEVSRWFDHIIAFVLHLQFALLAIWKLLKGKYFVFVSCSKYCRCIVWYWAQSPDHRFHPVCWGWKGGRPTTDCSNVG